MNYLYRMHGLIRRTKRDPIHPVVLPPSPEGEYVPAESMKKRREMFMTAEKHKMMPNPQVGDRCMLRHHILQLSLFPNIYNSKFLLENS